TCLPKPGRGRVVAGQHLWPSRVLSSSQPNASMGRNRRRSAGPEMAPPPAAGASNVFSREAGREIRQRRIADSLQCCGLIDAWDECFRVANSIFSLTLAYGGIARTWRTAGG